MRLFCACSAVLWLISRCSPVRAVAGLFWGSVRLFSVAGPAVRIVAGSVLWRVLQGDGGGGIGKARSGAGNPHDPRLGKKALFSFLNQVCVYRVNV